MFRFTYDVVCPFAYLASTRVAALAEEAGRTITWDPILLGGVLRALERPDIPMEAMPAAKARLKALDIVRQASMLDEPLEVPAAHPRRTVAAMRCLIAADRAVVPELTRALYRAYWIDGVDVADLDVLAPITAPFGVDAVAVQADEAVRQGLFDATADAVSRGVFGVPTLEIDGELFYGTDRLRLVRRKLGLPRIQDAVSEPPAGGTIEFLHDFSSPYSYLASTQIEAFAEWHGAEVIYTPFLLGGLFKAIGTPMVPLHAMSGPAQRYAGKDMLDWAKWWGVDFRFPSNFPLRTITPLRAAIVEPQATFAMYRAAWTDDQNIGDPEVLGRVLDDAGFDGRAILEGTRDPAVKQQLIANSTRAEQLGVCGVPTFRVNDQLFWGQDRFDMVARALTGWSVLL